MHFEFSQTKQFRESASKFGVNVKLVKFLEPPFEKCHGGTRFTRRARLVRTYIITLLTEPIVYTEYEFMDRIMSARLNILSGFLAIKCQI